MLDWLEHHPGLGSWAQAIGTIGAVLAAIGVSRIEGTRAKRAERERAAALVAAALIPLRNIGIDAQLVLDSRTETVAQLRADIRHFTKVLSKVPVNTLPTPQLVDTVLWAQALGREIETRVCFPITDHGRARMKTVFEEVDIVLSTLDAEAKKLGHGRGDSIGPSYLRRVLPRTRMQDWAHEFNPHSDGEP